MTARNLIAKRAAIVAAFGVFAIPLQPLADAQAWKVGSSYVIRHQHLDLTRPADRLALLIQVERSAAKLCEGVRTSVRRKACVSSAVTESLGAASPRIRQAIQSARVERDGELQAQR